MPMKQGQASVRADLEGAAPGGLLAIPGKLTKDAAKIMLKDAPRVSRYVLRTIPGAPGFVYDAADIATAKDKWRAAAGAVGGIAGVALGEFGGPVGAAVGATAGEAGAKWLYDHHGELQDELRRKAADTAQWMKDRTAQAAHGFDRGMPPFGSPLR